MSFSRPAENLVLVTGGAGYIGSALVARLLETGATVRVFDPLLYGAGALADFHDQSRFSLIAGNPVRVEDVQCAVAGVTQVVHLGAIVGDPACALDPAFTLAANVESTRLLVEAAAAIGVRRFIFASTCSVYGAGDHELDEAAPLEPQSLYAESKVTGERIAFGSPAIVPVVLRFGTVFGASRRARFDLVVNLLAAKAAAGEPIRIFGGEQWRPFVHVEDIVTAIGLALAADERVASGEVFNVGSARENRRLAELGDMIGELVPGTRVEVDHSSVDRRDYRADFSKIARQLRFVPSWSLRDGIQQLLRQLHDDASLDFRDAAYANDRALTRLRSIQGELGFGFGFDRITSG